MTGNKDVKQLSRSPYHLLKRAAQYAAYIYQGEVGKAGLTQRQFTVLIAVDQNEGVSQTALVKMTGIDRSTLADLVGASSRRKAICSAGAPRMTAAPIRCASPRRASAC